MPPRELSNRYEILRHLARGGMAEVYLARDHLLDRPVAIKILFPDYARDQKFVERFRREAKAAANLNHPNIVAVYDWGEDDGTYFIVMEYVEGRSLRDVIHDGGALLPERAAEIAADIAAALGFAHRHGVVHRDVKPGNVLLTTQGQVKVTDFGIARAGTSDQLTRTGMVMGTAAYFSPEQAQGLPVDPRSDVYSLGVVLYEMVTGEPPFGGDEPVAIAYQHVREEPTAPSLRNPDVPPELEKIVLTALTKQPNDRYASADDMRADLIRFQKGLPVEAEPVTALVAETIDDTIVAAGAQPTRVATRAVPPVGPGSRPPERRRMTAFFVTLAVLVLVLLGLLYLLGRQLGVFGGARTVAVPGVVGKDYTDAKAQLEGLGLKVKGDFQNNDQVPANQVFKQDPDQGTKIGKGETVTLTVSKGAATAPVPDVVDKLIADARRILEGAGFKVKAVSQSSDTVSENRVIRTDPTAGSLAAKGSEISVYVSSGKQPVAVPDVTGKDAVEAANLLGEAGFAVSRVDQPSDSVPQGKVIATDPPAGQEAPRRSTVKMIVSSGAAKVTVPDVRGLGQSEAIAKLQSVGLQASTTTETVSDPAQDGKVTKQLPGAGTQVDKGSTVQLTVGKYLASTTTTSSFPTPTT